MTETARMTIECGRLSRGAVRRALKTTMPLGVTAEIDEDFGMLDGVFVIRASGDGAARWLTAFRRAADRAGMT